MRIAFLLACLVLLPTFAPLRLHRPPDPPRHATLSFEPVPIRPAGDGNRRVDGLRFLGGWSITSNDYRFGGISAMHVGAHDVLAASDAGIIFHFTRPDRSADPAIRITPLPDGPGSPLRKSDRDSEAMAVADGHVWIAFERKNAVWRYHQASLARERAAYPKAMRKWPANSGSEAMLRLADGRFLIFSEGTSTDRPDDGEISDAILFDGDPADPATKVTSLRYRPPKGYRITDATSLPDGRILLLNRRFALFEGLKAKLVVMAPIRFEEGGILEGEPVADLRSPVTVDNMEALSVTQEQGRTIVWIASDDNFNPLQRTLLLKFELVG